MRTSVFLGLLLATSTLAFSGTGATAGSNGQSQAKTEHGIRLQPLNIKPGLWEITYSQNNNGEMPLPSEYLSRLTPEQRARVEAAMKQHAAEHTRNKTYQSCAKKGNIDNSFLNPRDAECQTTVLKSTSSEASGKMVCSTEGMHSQGTMDVQVLDSEHTKGTSHITISGNGHTFTSDATMSGKWIGSDCKGVE